jgi:hypothetical protein
MKEDPKLESTDKKTLDTYNSIEKRRERIVHRKSSLKFIPFEVPNLVAK